MSCLSTKFCHLLQHISTTKALNRSILVPTVNSVQARNYAARKGTRERKLKAKVKVEVQKVGFIPHNLRNREKMLAAKPSKKFDDSRKMSSIDDVYSMRYYKWIVYPFVEAVKAHKETHHPEMYNKPNAELIGTIDLNMQGEKKTRFVENFKRIAAIPHKFDHGEERTIIAFAKNTESQKEAANVGAQLAGGVDLIKDIQNGHVLLQDFQYIVAHPDILPELVVLRGVMKKKFPSPKAGTLDTNLGELVKKYLNGVSYQAIKDEYEKDFGQIDVVIGTLNMNEKHLEENFAAILSDVQKQKPKRSGSFITRCTLRSPPSREILRVDHELYIADKEISSTANEESEDVKVESIAL